ncbi:MAG TPA: NAD-dependent epimerase/dehydratase family protein [Terriglobia bacterium]|nr:NAD-dependent epimerase/dehydratase family protein [Terriglobia bacterium]
MTTSARYFLVGGAGFIGSHFTDRLLSDPHVERVTVFDNFTSGRTWHYGQHLENSRFSVVRGDVKDIDLLTSAMRYHDVVIHLASNPDIARAAIEPDIDFREGTLLSNNVVEAMRRSGASTILYASGSGVYGDLGEKEAHEDYGPLLPISTYGASKLAGEGLISSYSYMFDLRGHVFRFGNVVGPRQTHGVGFDFLRQLLKNPLKLRILGDGTQSKSYIHVRDVVDAVLLTARRSEERFSVHNVATGDYITVTEIAHLAVECAGVDSSRVEFEYTGGSRGWKGDIPIVRLNTARICSLGWNCSVGSREALRQSMLSMLADLKAGRL